jgi:hypothetical protein
VTAPYREPAPVLRARPASRYVPVSRRRDRLWRVLRSVPVLLIATAAFILEQPWLVGAAIVWGLGTIGLRRVHERALAARLKVLTGSLARGADPMVAARGLEAVVADARDVPAVHSISVLLLAIARARGGDVDGALELLHAVDEGGWLTGREAWQAWLLPWMSQLHAARGDLDLAEKWLAVARERLASSPEVLVSPATVLALRRGRYEEVIAEIDALDGLQTAAEPLRHHYALLRAFACEQAGRPLPAEEAVRVVSACVAAPHARPFPLEKWWGELATFVERHATG